MGNLFETKLFPQTDGVLSPRWNQQGSKLINIQANVYADTTIYTVTTGKTFYLQQMSILDQGSDHSSNMRDGGSGGTLKMGSLSMEYGLITYNFDPPLEFKSNVWIDEVSSGLYLGITITGWEE